MPRKIRRKRGTKIRRKLRRRIKRKGKATRTVIKSPSGFADRLFVKLRYSDLQLYTINSGIAVKQVFRGNSIFDPDQTGSGHQPYGFDQWAAFYGSYRVHGSKIHCRMVGFDNTSAATQAMWMNVHPDMVTTAASYPYPLDEIPYSTTKVYGNSNTQTNGMNDIKKYMSTAKFYGLNKNAVKNDHVFAALVSANPTNNWYWHIVAGVVNQSASSSCYIQVKLTYYVEFFNRNTLSSS